MKVAGKEKSSAMLLRRISGLADPVRDSNRIVYRPHLAKIVFMEVVAISLDLSGCWTSTTQKEVGMMSTAICPADRRYSICRLLGNT